MIITISGKPGSGKSTVAARLAADLGYKRYYIGGMRRQAAKERGMTLEEFNKLGETDPATDHGFDAMVEKLGATEDDFIIEGRLAWHFIPQSLKIFIDVSAEEGARRIWGALEKNSQADRNEGRALKSYEDVLASIRKRVESDTRRYEKYYGLEIFDPSHYDLFLDATPLNPEHEYRAVFSFVKKRLK
ncbi:MAG: cytidylate kinase family protein [Patescibacteria group bacterium]